MIELNKDSLSIIALIFRKTTSLALLFILGWYLRRINFLSSETVKNIARLIIDVTMPLVFFYGIVTSDIFGKLEQFLSLFFGAIIICSLGLFYARISQKILNIQKSKIGTYLVLCTQGNAAFIPLPLAYALLGSEGAIACFVYIFGNDLFLFTISANIIRGSSAIITSTRAFLVSFFSSLFQPLIIAILSGTSFAFLSYQNIYELPSLVLEPMDALGQTTFPLAMLVTGGIIANIKIADDFDWRFQFGVILNRLLLVPLSVIILLIFFPQPKVVSMVLMIQASMPTFTTATSFAHRFGGDAEQAATTVMLTTLGSAFTLPLWLTLLDSLVSNRYGT